MQKVTETDRKRKVTENHVKSTGPLLKRLKRSLDPNKRFSRVGRPSQLPEDRRPGITSQVKSEVNIYIIIIIIISLVLSHQSINQTLSMCYRPTMYVWTLA